MTPTSNKRAGAATSEPPAKSFCSACGTALSAGARFCHRCGTPAGAGVPAGRAQGNSLATVLPWGVAFVALVALVAVFASRNSEPVRGPALDASGAPFAAGGMRGGAPPDISNMSASEQASLLFNRVMTYAEQGKLDSAAFFAPMAMASHEMIDNPSDDERYHYGLVAQVAGNPAVARAQADTILARSPNSLLGLMLGAGAARKANDTRAAADFDRRFLQVLASELASGNEDYELHRFEIDRYTTEARRSN